MADYQTQYKNYSKHAVIMISTDRAIFEPASDVRERMVAQAGKYKELNIVVFSITDQKLAPIRLTNNAWAYPTASMSRWFYIFGAYRQGKKILKQLDSQTPILITCQDPFETGIVGYLLSKIKRSELLLQLHTDLYSPYFTQHSFLNQLRRFIANYLLPRADYVRTVSHRVADSLIGRGIPYEKIILKPVTIAAAKIGSGDIALDLHQKYSQFSKIALMVSRLELEKNIDGALRAWPLVLGQIPQAGLIIVGSGGQLLKLKRLARSLQIDSNVVFEGWQKELTLYYKSCDIFLHTSWYEGYGLALAEARAAGREIVSTDVGIAREVGAHLTKHDERDIARVLTTVLRQRVT